MNGRVHGRIKRLADLTEHSQRLTRAEVARIWFRRGPEYDFHAEHPQFPQAGPDGLYLLAMVKEWFDDRIARDEAMGPGRYRKEIPPPVVPPRPPRPARAIERRIYFILAPNSVLIKIGSSLDPQRRLAVLRTGSAEPLEMIGSFPGTRQQEMALHKRFEAFWVKGEWFRPGRPLMDYMKEVLA